MLESHENVSILLSDMHKLLLCDSPLNSQTWFWTHTAARMHVKQTERNEIGAQ